MHCWEPREVDCWASLGVRRQTPRDTDCLSTHDRSLCATFVQLCVRLHRTLVCVEECKRLMLTRVSQLCSHRSPRRGSSIFTLDQKTDIGTLYRACDAETLDEMTKKMVTRREIDQQEARFLIRCRWREKKSHLGCECLGVFFFFECEVWCLFCFNLCCELSLILSSSWEISYFQCGRHAHCCSVCAVSHKDGLQQERGRGHVDM